MSGTNRTVMSDVVMENGSESALTKALENANERAIAKEKKGKKVKRG